MNVASSTFSSPAYLVNQIILFIIFSGSHLHFFFVGVIDTDIIGATRMHSSGMRYALSSSRPGGSPIPRDQAPPRTRHPQIRHPLGPGTPPGTRQPLTQHPPDQAPPSTRHLLGPGPPGPGTPLWTGKVNILPCPKLRLRVVKITTL